MFDFPAAKFALESVREAALLASEVQKEMCSPALTKSDKSPVTIGDFAVQALVARKLQATFPDDELVGEEDSDALKEPDQKEILETLTEYVSRVVDGVSSDQVCDWIDIGNGEPSERYWTLDPIDGTKGFLRQAQYAVAFALIENGEVVLGVLGCPNLKNCCEEDYAGEGSLVIAAKGQGAFAGPLRPELDLSNFKQLSTSSESDPRNGRMLRSAAKEHTNTGKIGEIVEKLAVQASPVGMDSQAKYAVLASGNGEQLFRLISQRMPDYRECIWDQAAGTLVVREAGGRVTDLDGKPLDFSTGRKLTNNRGVLATNGPLHDRSLEVLKEVSA